MLLCRMNVGPHPGSMWLTSPAMGMLMASRAGTGAPQPRLRMSLLASGAYEVRARSVKFMLRASSGRRSRGSIVSMPRRTLTMVGNVRMGPSRAGNTLENTDWAEGASACSWRAILCVFLRTSLSPRDKLGLPVIALDGDFPAA